MNEISDFSTKASMVEPQADVTQIAKPAEEEEKVSAPLTPTRATAPITELALGGTSREDERVDDCSDKKGD